MDSADEPMVTIDGGSAPTPEIELERAAVSVDQVRRFLASAAPAALLDAAAPHRVPLSFALALRRGHGPEATISPRAFAIHGGHDIAARQPIRVGATYVVSGRVERVYGKTGRSGPLTVVERRVWIREPDRPPAIEITDRQIVRWKPPGAQAASVGRGTARQPSDEDAIATPPHVGSLELGDSIGPYRRRGPAAGEISSWADSLRDREILFHDRGGARALGYDDLVVPGPMQSAIVDCWLTAAAPAWRATAMHMTFRQSLIAGEAFSIEAVVVDGSDDRRSLDVLVRRAASGEPTATGTVTLETQSNTDRRG